MLETGPERSQLQQFDDQAKKGSQEYGKQARSAPGWVCRQIRAEEKTEGHESHDVDDDSFPVAAPAEVAAPNTQQWLMGKLETARDIKIGAAAQAVVNEVSEALLESVDGEGAFAGCSGRVDAVSPSAGMAGDFG